MKIYSAKIRTVKRIATPLEIIDKKTKKSGDQPRDVHGRFARAKMNYCINYEHYMEGMISPFPGICRNKDIVCSDRFCPVSVIRREGVPCKGYSPIRAKILINTVLVVMCIAVMLAVICWASK